MAKAPVFDFLDRMHRIRDITAYTARPPIYYPGSRYAIPRQHHESSRLEASESSLPPPLAADADLIAFVTATLGEDMGRGALQALSSFGIHTLDDLKVVASDESEWAGLRDPALSAPNKSRLKSALFGTKPSLVATNPLEESTSSNSSLGASGVGQQELDSLRGENKALKDSMGSLENTVAMLQKQLEAQNQLQKLLEAQAAAAASAAAAAAASAAAAVASSGDQPQVIVSPPKGPSAASSREPSPSRATNSRNLTPTTAPKPVRTKKRTTRKPREEVESVGKDAATLRVKVETANGDMIRLRAAVDQTKSLVSDMSTSLVEMTETVQQEAKKDQLIALSQNLEVMKSELIATGAKVLEDPNNKREIFKLTTSLKQIEDTADMALSEGTEILNAELKEVISHVPLFQGLEEVGFLNLLFRRMTYEVVKPQESIVEFGDIGESMYFLTKGKVGVYSEHKEKVMELGKGSFFGEIAIFRRGTRTASIRALDEHVEVYELEKEALESALAQYPQYKDQFELVVAARLREDARKAAKKSFRTRAEQLPLFSFREPCADVRRLLGRKAPDLKAIYTQVKQCLENAVRAPLVSALADTAQSLTVASTALEQAANAASDKTPSKAALLAALQALSTAIAKEEMTVFLSVLPPFSETDEGLRLRLVAAGRLQVLAPEQVVTRRNVAPVDLLFVLTGSLVVSAAGGKSGHGHSGICDRGTVCGEEWADIAASGGDEGAEVFAISRQQVLDLTATNEEWRRKMEEYL